MASHYQATFTPAELELRDWFTKELTGIFADNCRYNIDDFATREYPNDELESKTLYLILSYSARQTPGEATRWIDTGRNVNIAHRWAITAYRNRKQAEDDMRLLPNLNTSDIFKAVALVSFRIHAITGKPCNLRYVTHRLF